MMAALTSNRRALWALAVFATLMIVIAGGMLLATTLIQAKWLEIDARQTDSEVLRRRIAAAAQTGTADPAISVDPFLEGANVALASNALQQRVVNLVETSGGTLITVGIDPPSTQGDEAGVRVVVQAVAQMTNDGLQEMLYRLENEAPFVFVENLTASRLTAQGAGAGEDGQKTLRLAVDLRVTAYFRKGDR